MKKTILALTLIAGGALMGAPVTYNAVITTGITPGTLGFLDFQFANSGVLSPAGTALMSNFTPTAGLNNPVASGGAIGGGSLTTTLSIANSGGFNDYFVGYTFPGVIMFDVTFSGPAVDDPPPGSGFGSTFGFAMFASDGVTPLGTSDPNGFLFTFDINTDGTRVLNNFSTGGAAVRFTSTTIPEPGSMLLFSAGLAAVTLFRLKRESN